MTAQKPIQLILAMLPQLTDKEKMTLRTALQMKERHPCNRLGHSFKTVRTIKSAWWFVPTKSVCVCTRCGKEKRL